MQNYFNDTQDVLNTTDRIIKNDILYCQTSLIENKNFFNLHSWDAYECAENLYTTCPECDGSGCDYCDDGQTIQEPLEWWLISEWLHNHLKNLGFVTLETDFGYYWGRTISGQAIELDNVIQDVARLIHNQQRQLS